MVNRILSLVIGLALVVSVALLGYRATEATNLVIWFGLASAILVPSGIALIGYAFSAGDRQVLAKLSKITELDKLVAEADTQEERIQLLEDQRHLLVETVELEARKMSAITRKDALETNAAAILRELEALDEEIRMLDEKVNASDLSDDVARLHTRVMSRRKGDIVVKFGSYDFIIPRRFINEVPFLSLYIDTAAKMMNWFDSAISRDAESTRLKKK